MKADGRFNRGALIGVARAVGVSLTEFYAMSPYEFFAAIAGWTDANSVEDTTAEPPSDEGISEMMMQWRKINGRL